MYVCMYVCMYVRTYVRMYVCMYVYVYIYIYIHVYTHIHMHAYTHGSPPHPSALRGGSGFCQEEWPLESQRAGRDGSGAHSGAPEKNNEIKQ